MLHTMAKQRPTTRSAANPFRYSGPVSGRELIPRPEIEERMLSLVAGGHSIRMIGPRRYGKTSLLGELLRRASAEGMATVLVDLEDVLSVGELVVRIERAYDRALKGPLRRHVEALFNVWNVGLSLGAAGFTATFTANPRVNAEAVLLRILDLPRALHERTGRRTVVVFDEIQDILAIPGADGKIRSVIQHHGDAAAYAFAGSAPGLMARLFEDPRRPLLEQAVPIELPPLDPDGVARHVQRRFRATGKRAGRGLAPLVEFTRGHPQRSMLLAHHLWERTRAGAEATEESWTEARDAALRESSVHLRAIFKALKPNERRVMLALANLSAPLRSREATAAVGLNPNSAGAAVERLREGADVIEPQLITDPLFGFWLKRRGLVGV
jgi:uncharacterized protein